jgi:hypothetical protein
MANAYVQMDEPGPEGDTSVVNNTAPPPDERWRGKTFYLNLAAGTDIGLLQKPGSARIQEGMLMPALFAGIEWVFLDFLALEVDLIKPRLLNDDSQNYFLSVTAPLLIKGVFRPGGVMLEPYVGVEAAFGLWGNAEIPLLSAIGGAQLGFRAGQSSAWTLDIGVTRNVFGTFSVAGDGYNLLRFHVMAGWKTGWKDRPPRAVKEQSVPVAE